MAHVCLHRRKSATRRCAKQGAAARCRPFKSTGRTQVWLIVLRGQNALGGRRGVHPTGLICGKPPMTKSRARSEGRPAAVGDRWRRLAGGGWRLAGGGWRLAGGGWWLVAVGGWRLAAEARTAGAPSARTARAASSLPQKLCARHGKRLSSTSRYTCVLYLFQTTRAAKGRERSPCHSSHSTSTTTPWTSCARMPTREGVSLSKHASRVILPRKQRVGLAEGLLRPVRRTGRRDVRGAARIVLGRRFLFL